MPATGNLLSSAEVFRRVIAAVLREIQINFAELDRKGELLTKSNFQE